MSAAEVTQIASAVFAALAAAGSAVAAAVMYRQWNASVTPALTIDLSQWQPSGRLFATIVNHGAAVKKASIVAVEGSQACVGFVPLHAFIEAGEKVRLELHVDPASDLGQVAVVYGFDLSGNRVYAWAANGQSGRWRTRNARRCRARSTNLSPVHIFKQFYPSAPDPMSLEKRNFGRLDGTAF